MSTFPPPSNTSVQNVIPSYLYTEYNDDDNMQYFVQMYNAFAQAYLDYLNNLQLPIYTSPTIVGPLLDWVANGLYGLPRPGLPVVTTPAQGPYNTFQFNQLTYNGQVPAGGGVYYATSDDIYKRILTWLFYKGDGKVFNMRWLKRRIARFLNGLNGTDPLIDQTYTINVALTSASAATITVPKGPIATIFSEAVRAGILELPFQIAWTVVLV